MTDKRPLDDSELDGLFAAARGANPLPSDALMQRIMADATAEIAAAQPERPARRGILATALAMIGGWPAAAGLATAAVTGLMIGLLTPNTLADTLDSLGSGFLTTANATYELEDLMPSYGTLLEES